MSDDLSLTDEIARVAALRGMSAERLSAAQSFYTASRHIPYHVTTMASCMGNDREADLRVHDALPVLVKRAVEHSSLALNARFVTGMVETYGVVATAKALQELYGCR